MVDVGASRGQFALFASARFPDARIICFEPFPDALEVARRVLATKAVKFHNVALGSSPGETVLHVAARDDSSSLLPIGPRQIAAFPGTHEKETIKVRVDVLDEYLHEELPLPWLLKIDVQGFELAVLQGTRESLASFDSIVIEVSFVELYSGQSLATDVIRYLDEQGFNLADVYNLVRAADRTALQADLLFHRQ